MRLSRVGELPLLDLLRRRFAKESSGLVIGIGDDAAAVRPARGSTLLTTDMMVEGIHFDLSWTTPFQLGFRLVSANVSDIYAMAGRPDYLLIDFSAPATATKAFFDSFFDGVSLALGRYGIQLIGGDISSSRSVVVAATVIGSSRSPVSRSGARPGDGVYLTSATGDAACGLELMRRHGRPVLLEKGRRGSFPLPWHTVEPLIRRHLMPVARDPRNAGRTATAMIDVSDGLLIDLSRLCSMSGVGADIFEDRVPVSAELRDAASALSLPWRDYVYAGGEDFELLFTSAAEVRGALRIGEITRNRRMRLIDSRGRARPISAKGYQHFAIQGTAQTDAQR